MENCKKLKHSDITAWLIEIGALKVISYPDGKTIKRPTASGEKLGISTEIRMGMYGAYTVVIYNRAAQQFILDNIDAVIAATNSKL